MTDRLPNNDPDLALAKKIEELRQHGQSLSDLDDPIVQDLLDYKQEKLQSHIQSETKQDVWDQIEKATQPQEKAKIFSLPSSSAIRWAAAAVIIIAGVFSFFYFQGSHQPKLLASSGQSIQTVTLKDGSSITLRPHSKLFTVKKVKSKAVYKLKGEAQFDVTHNPSRTFTVKTTSGVISVLGTRFVLSSWGHRMQVYLQRGKVKVEDLQHADSVIIQPGEAAVVSKAKPIKVVKKAKAKEFTDWLSQRLVFNNELARQVIEELEQQFNISISLPKNIEQKRISGQLSLKKLQSVLDDLALVLNGSFQKTSPKSYIFKPSSM